MLKSFAPYRDSLPGSFAAIHTALEVPKIARRVVAGLLVVHSILLGYSAYVHSPTLNEPAHLVAGLSHWKFGRFDVYNVNPPLVKMVAALPVMAVGNEEDWSGFYEGPGARPEMAMGRDFCNANGYRTFWLMTIARWACIPFSLLGGYICFRWGSELYGASAGLLSLTLWCLCPNIIAHGQLITCDAAATAFAVAACYTFWHWLKQPTWWNCFASGLILGFAELTKATLVVLYPLWPVLWLVYRWPERRRLTAPDWLREFGMLFARVLIGLSIMNLGYGLEGSFTQLGDFTFVSRVMTGLEDSAESPIAGNRFVDSWLGRVPVPLPKNYVLGVDLQRKDFESYRHEFYLGGVWSKTGWWYYYLYALAIKVPLGTWLLILLAIGANSFTTVLARFLDELYLLAPALVILAFVSCQSGINEHMRYVLPIFPFFIIWIGRLMPAVVAVSVTFEERDWMKGTVAGGLVIAALLWSVGSSLWCYPHSLAYFNEIVGGPKYGWKRLAHSNIDWGQDLLYLKHWIDEHSEATPLGITYFGPIEPSLVGIPRLDAESNITYATEYDETLRPGWYAVSASFLAGFVQGPCGRDTFRALRDIPEYDLVGGSIFIYRLSQSLPGKLAIPIDGSMLEHEVDADSSSSSSGFGSIEAGRSQDFKN